MAAILVLASCAKSSESPELTAARARADHLLQRLRAEQWTEAAGFVSVDLIAQQRMEIPEGASPEAQTQRVANWFEEIYGNVKPGSIHSIELDPVDPQLVLVTYRAGDLDAFNMRLIDGEWMYILD